jgi:hypothetical protein
MPEAPPVTMATLPASLVPVSMLSSQFVLALLDVGTGSPQWQGYLALQSLEFQALCAEC